jgi:hypothetical protein
MSTVDPLQLTKQVVLQIQETRNTVKSVEVLPV